MKRALRLLVIILWTYGICPAAQVPVEERVKQMINPVNARMNNEDLAAFVGTDRAEIISLLKQEAAARVTNTYDSHKATSLLLRLDDKETIEAVGAELTDFSQKYDNPRVDRIAYDSKQPRMMRFFARRLFLPKDIPVAIGMHGIRRGRQYAALSCMQHLILGCEEFSPALKVSVGGLRDLGSEQSIDVMKHWWTENVTAFAQEDFVAVKPLPIPAARAPDVEPAPRSTPMLAPSNSMAGPTPPVAFTAESNGPSQGHLLTITAAAVALLAGLVFLLKRPV